MSGLGSKVMSIEFQWLITGSVGVCSGLGWRGRGVVHTLTPLKSSAKPNLTEAQSHDLVA